MKLRRSGTIVTVVAILVISSLGWTSIAGAEESRTLQTILRGANEIPGPGDPDGKGVAQVTLKPGQGEVCVQIAVSRIAPATAAHIHVGAKGVAGPVVVGLPTPQAGASTGCTSVSEDLIAAILQNPSNYYVNVHNTPYPAGAVRGQLGN
jgi:hypothetical protein